MMPHLLDVTEQYKPPQRHDYTAIPFRKTSTLIDRVALL
jgi:hypothetical protein